MNVIPETCRAYYINIIVVDFVHFLNSMLTVTSYIKVHRDVEWIDSFSFKMYDWVLHILCDIHT